MCNSISPPTGPNYNAVLEMLDRALTGPAFCQPIGIGVPYFYPVPVPVGVPVPVPFGVPVAGVPYGSDCVPMPSSGCLPPPAPELCGPPAGRGLTKNADGSITTAGGYRIAATGDKAGWKIFGPDGKPLTHVYGDPHVKEKDGTKWDFTESSNFILPDGTRIFAKTGGGKNKGKTVTQALDITNGSDRAQITGVNGRAPTTGEVAQDRAGWEREHGAVETTFELNHDAYKQDWVKTRRGVVEGVVVGSREAANGSYKQVTNQRANADVSKPFESGFGDQDWARAFEQTFPNDQQTADLIRMLRELLYEARNDEQRQLVETRFAQPQRV